MRRPQILLLLALLLPAFLAAAAVGDDRARPVVTEEAIFRAFDREDYAGAARLLETYVERHPDDSRMLYNLACAYSRLGRPTDGSTALYRAVEAGFRDFAFMREDPDLDAIRNEPLYKAIVEAARKTTRDARRGPRPAGGAQNAVDTWRATYGDEDYRYTRDEKHRLVFATALDEESDRAMREMLMKEADYLIEHFFDAPPDYEVLIAIPTPEHADRIFNGNANVGGRYEHAGRRIIARDIGGSLRHEFVHALHYGHMERLGLRDGHALWVQEGLASLFEDYTWTADGGIRFLPNDRINVVKNLVRNRRITPWNRFMTQPSRNFMAESLRTYPQARAIFRYLAEEGKLAAWYAEYVATFEEDRTGRLAFERIFGAPLESIEEDWQAWVRRQKKHDDFINYGDAALGIRIDGNGVNDGVRVDEVIPGSTAALAGLRRGDVIVEVEGRSTRSIRELQSVIGARRVGDRVAIRFRRDDRYITKRVTLRPLRQG